ncbi:MAG: hypothetical protein ACW981_04375 [Candidatus Hodarchaeales archaeon]
MAGLTESILSEKDFEIDRAIDTVIQSAESLDLVLKSLQSKNDTLRHNCFQITLIISHVQAPILYSHWDYFKTLLLSTNTFHKVIGIKILSNLVKVDTHNKFDDIFDLFVEFTQSEKLLLVRTVYKAFGKIATINPKLQDKTLQILLKIDKIPHKHVELAKTDVIEALNLFYENSNKKDQILEFVQKQQGSSSPKTRKTAELFLEKYISSIK